jgi:hypothetical protein
MVLNLWLQSVELNRKNQPKRLEPSTSILQLTIYWASTDKIAYFLKVNGAGSDDEDYVAENAKPEQQKKKQTKKVRFSKSYSFE